MNKIPFLNIADVNCWMVYLMPFATDDRANYELVSTLQQTCIEAKIFGMGWDMPCFEYGTLISDENAAIYIEKYKKQGGSVSEDAVNGYKAIRKGDYVITRLKNSHYYVGRVSSEGAMYIYKENDPVYGRFSWGGTVDKWIEFANDGELPSEIAGRFSQRLHSTIQRIAPYRQRLLVISMYENFEADENRRFEIPRLKIGVNNFVRSLNYMELEDLVALYISNKHGSEGYKLLPSSCKVSQQNFEFRFVANGRKPITCQVKNQHDIEIDYYIQENSYEYLYIFSGKWNDECVGELRGKYEEYKHIYIISPSELFEALKKDNIFENKFYDFDNEPTAPDRLPLDGYHICTRPKKENECSVSGDFVCFIKKDGLVYSSEFGALVLSWHILEDREYEQRCIDQILKDINRGTNV